MKTTSIVLSIVLLVSFTCLADFSIGLELYPQRMDGLTSGSSDWLYNGEEWFATTVGFDKELIDGLTIGGLNVGSLTAGFNIKTYLFGTNGFSYAPSSVKYTNWVSYSFNRFTVKYSHYCHHYFKQYPSNPYSDQDKVVLEYSFGG